MGSLVALQGSTFLLFGLESRAMFGGVNGGVAYGIVQHCPRAERHWCLQQT
jgi:hypothetical protein